MCSLETRSYVNLQLSPTFSDSDVRHLFHSDFVKYWNDVWGACWLSRRAEYLSSFMLEYLHCQGFTLSTWVGQQSSMPGWSLRHSRWKNSAPCWVASAISQRPLCRFSLRLCCILKSTPVFWQSGRANQ